MSEFKIDAVGPYRQRDGGRAEVKFIDGDRAYGRDSTGRSHTWCTHNGANEYDLPCYVDLVARWPRFEVGDRVRVQIRQCDLGGRCGVVREVFQQGATSYLVWFEGGSEYFEESELVPDDRPDPGPEHRLLGDDEILQGGDERIDGCDPEPRRWLGPLKESELIGRTVREVNSQYRSLNILAWRRRLPKPEKPEQWTPTYELRHTRIGAFAIGAHMVFMSKEDGYKYVRLEQRWTCGDKSEWRPIPVEVPE